MNRRLTSLSAASVVTAGISSMSTSALAHHGMGGAMPTTWGQGLLSGLAHPVIGPDHLAFVVGIGLLAGLAGYGLALPVLFVLAMTGGLALHIAGMGIPGAELLVAISVLLIGLALVRRRSTVRGPWLEAGAFGLAGLFHGYAFAESIIGAETTPLAAYIVGLAVVQVAIASGALMLGRGGDGGGVRLSPALVRVAGMVIAGVGVAFVALAGGVA